MAGSVARLVYDASGEEGGVSREGQGTGELISTGKHPCFLQETWNRAWFEQPLRRALHGFRCCVMYPSMYYGEPDFFVRGKMNDSRLTDIYRLHFETMA